MSSLEKIEYKSYYTGIFSINYLFQGVTTSIFAVIFPIYLLGIYGTLSAADLAFLTSIVLIPWSFKFVFGILSDKYGSKNMGRRKPWILGFVMIAGVLWIVLGTPNLMNKSNAIIIIAIVGIIISTSIAVGDTALDGLIIDICPEEKLGRTQGFCWGLNSVGAIAGGPLFAFLIFILENIRVETVFIIVGIMTIICSLLILKVREPKDYPKVVIKKHLKNMFRYSKDWNAYFYSFGRALLDGVVIVLVSLFILIKLGYLSTEGITLSLKTVDTNIYLYQANISIIISIGVVIGAIMGGHIADRISRRSSVFLSVVITFMSLLLIIFETGFIPILLFFTSLIGVAMGLRRSSSSAVIGEMAKDHPEMDSTYFSIANSFANLGTSLGLFIVGVIFNIYKDFALTFLFMAIMSLIVLIPFLLLKRENYEYKLSNNSRN